MPGKRPFKLWLLAGLFCAGTFFWWLILVRNGTHNLSYEGKPLANCFNQLPMTHLQGTEVRVGLRQSARHLKSGVVQKYGTWIEEPDVSAKAIRAMGTNGLKLYLTKVGRQEGALGNLVCGKIQQAAFGLGLRRFLFEDVTAEREQAVTALILLKPLPNGAVGTLSTLSTNRNAEIARAARCVLLGEPGKLRLPPTPDEAIRALLEDKRFDGFSGSSLRLRSSAP